MYPLLLIRRPPRWGARRSRGTRRGGGRGGRRGHEVPGRGVGRQVRPQAPVVGGYGLAAVGKVIIAAAGVWPVVLLGRVVDRIGKGIRGHHVMRCCRRRRPQALGRVFGFHRAADTLGAVIGPLLGLAILTATADDIGLGTVDRGDPRADQRGAGGPDARDRLRRPTNPRRRAGPEGAPQPATCPAPPSVRTLAAVLGLFALVNFPDVLILLRVNELGYSAAQVAGAYALFNLSSAAIAYPAGALSDRAPRCGCMPWALPASWSGTRPRAGGRRMGGGGAAGCLTGGSPGITDGVGKAWISALPRRMSGPRTRALPGPGRGRDPGGRPWAGLLWTAGPGSESSRCWCPAPSPRVRLGGAAVRAPA